MSLVHGNLLDFGFAPQPGLRPIIYFIPSNPAVSGADPQYLYFTRPIPCIPGLFGEFSVNLIDTGGMRPETWFTVRIDWLDDAGNMATQDFLSHRLYVPFEGGGITDLLNAPPNPLMAWVGPEHPINPIPGTGYLTIDGMYQEWEL